MRVDVHSHVNFRANRFWHASVFMVFTPQCMNNSLSIWYQIKDEISFLLYFTFPSTVFVPFFLFVIVGSRLDRRSLPFSTSVIKLLSDRTVDTMSCTGMFYDSVSTKIFFLILVSSLSFSLALTELFLKRFSKQNFDRQHKAIVPAITKTIANSIYHED